MNSNTAIVTAAFSISVLGAFGTAFAKASVVNDTIYGYSSNGICVVASSSLAPGCQVSGTGNTCMVLIYPPGAPAEYADAFKSPTSGAYCYLPIKRIF